MFLCRSRFTASICTSLFALSSSLIPLQAAALTSSSDYRSGKRTPENVEGFNRPVEIAGNGCVLGFCPLTEILEGQLRSLLSKEIPIQATNNHKVYPIVKRLPGEPFEPAAYNILNKNEKLPPGDYEFEAYFPCVRIYSFTGSGNQYVLAKLKGKMADVLAATHKRAGQAGTPVKQVQELSWSIQAGVPYRELPEQHQALVDTLIPEYRQKMKADFMDTFIKRYDALSKVANLPSRDEILNKLGLVGELARDLMRARQQILNTSLAYRSLENEFAPRQNVASTGSLEETPWSVVQKGIYMRFLAPQGALHEGVVQVRITEEAGENKQYKKFGETNDTQSKAIPLVIVGIVEANTIRIIISESVAIAWNLAGRQALMAILLNQSGQTEEEEQAPPSDETTSTAKPWDDLIKDAVKVSRPNAPEEVWEKPGQPGFDEANKDFDKLNPGNVKPMDTDFGPGRQGILNNGSTISVRPSSSGPNGRPTIQINPPKDSGSKPQKIRY